MAISMQQIAAAIRNKNTVFSILLIVVVLLVIMRSLPPSVDPVVTLVISQNRAPIRDIRQPRNIESTRKVAVDRLNLHHKNRFSHPKLGELGVGERFFVDVHHTIEVLEGGLYHFAVGSDDGFDLKIDGKRVCEYRKDRPFRTNHCSVQLDKGEHKFDLAYFQGFGNSGLTVEYRLDGTERSYYFGETSKFIDFD